VWFAYIISFFVTLRFYYFFRLFFCCFLLSFPVFFVEGPAGGTDRPSQIARW